MRTILSTSGTTGKTRGASVTTTLAALALAVPMSGLFGGSALAATADAGSTANGNSTAAPAAAALKRDDAAAKADTAKAADDVKSEAAKADASKAETAKAAAAKDSAAKADVAKADATKSDAATTTKPAGFIGPVIPASSTSGPNANTSSVPFTNQGGVTTGSNTTKYEVVNGRDGSPAVGGGQPSGDVQKVQPYSTADNTNKGANDTSASNNYASTRDGSPSLNGNGGGLQVGQPCAGCVGKADNKNPPGQYPNGSDHNAGYECDRNHGIGRSNPAHTSCTTGGTTGGTTSGGSVCEPTAANHHCNTDTPDCVPTAANHHCNTDTPDCVPTAANHHCNTDTPDCKKVMGGHTTDADCKNGGNPATPGTLPICHATGSASNPFVGITVSANGVLDGHSKHGDDIIPPYSYTDKSGNKINVAGQNWTAANQTTLHNGCSVPTTTVVTCPGGSAMPASGNIADCNPPKLCPNGSAMPANGICGSGGGSGGGLTCPNGSAMPASGKVADCNPPKTCPNGSAMPASGNVGDCTPPVVCSETAMVGPIVAGTIRPGCELAGGGSNPATGNVPGTTPVVPTVIAQGSQPQPVLGTVAGPATAPAVVRARPTALPFTGANAGLLAEGAALMLLLGAGLVFTTRKKTALTV